MDYPSSSENEVVRTVKKQAVKNKNKIKFEDSDIHFTWQERNEAFRMCPDWRPETPVKNEAERRLLAYRSLFVCVEYKMRGKDGVEYNQKWWTRKELMDKVAAHIKQEQEFRQWWGAYPGKKASPTNDVNTMCRQALSRHDHDYRLRIRYAFQNPFQDAPEPGTIMFFNTVTRNCFSGPSLPHSQENARAAVHKPNVGVTRPIKNGFVVISLSSVRRSAAQQILEEGANKEAQQPSLYQSLMQSRLPIVYVRPSAEPETTTEAPRRHFQKLKLPTKPHKGPQVAQPHPQGHNEIIGKLTSKDSGNPRTGQKPKEGAMDLLQPQATSLAFEPRETKSKRASDPASEADDTEIETMEVIQSWRTNGATKRQGVRVVSRRTYKALTGGVERRAVWLRRPVTPPVAEPQPEPKRRKIRDVSPEVDQYGKTKAMREAERAFAKQTRECMALWSEGKDISF